jgi:hypothetical protein
MKGVKSGVKKEKWEVNKETQKYGFAFLALPTTTSPLLTLTRHRSLTG